MRRAPVGLVLLGCCVLFGACASGARSGDAAPGDDAGFAGGDDASAGGLVSGDSGLVTGDGALVGPLSITPSDPVIDVDVVDGAVVAVAVGDAGASSIAFEAHGAGGARLPATWSIDRGELGALDVASGTFTPSGAYAGVGTITAAVGNTTATTSVTVRLHMQQNGGSAAGDAGAEAGAGGYGGVGGEGPGGAVDAATMGRLRGAAIAPASQAEFGLLYPYDGTVWPRGLLAPLVQWQTTHVAAAAYVHLTQKNFEFEGFYSGAALVHQPIDPVAWRAALNGNGGDPLVLEVKIADAASVYGPRAERWIVAPGVLRGTVYYDSYGTRLANPVPGANGAIASGAVLAIRPGATDPVLALPGSEDK